MRERNKAMIGRLADEVLNAERLAVIQELYAPTLAPRVKCRTPT